MKNKSNELLEGGYNKILHLINFDFLFNIGFMSSIGMILINHFNPIISSKLYINELLENYGQYIGLIIIVSIFYYLYVIYKKLSYRIKISKRMRFGLKYIKNLNTVEEELIIKMFYNFRNKEFDKYGVVDILHGPSGIVKELQDVGVMRLQGSIYGKINLFQAPYVLNKKCLKYLNRKYRNKTIERDYGKIIIKEREKHENTTKEN